VDNEPAIGRALQLLFEREGMLVATSTSGEAALALIESQRFDLMIVDLRMPDMRGDVLFHLASGAQPQLARRTIFMTGDISDQAAELIHACDCPLVLKPFDLNAMTSAVFGLLPHRRPESA
jgi:two-component system NtrC family sensor kinase